MKSKFDYKSKRTLIISLILIALIAVASIGTVAFMRGNKDTNAADNEYTENTSINGENNNSNSNQNTTNDKNTNTEKTDENSDNKDNNDNNATSENSTENTSENTSNTATTVTAEDGTELPSTTTNTTSNTGTRKNVKTFKTKEVKVYPTTEYTQPGNPIEKKVSDSLYVGWNPIDVNAITEELNRPELEIHKNSFINNETEEDTLIHTAVTINDYITYKVSVKNISEATDAKNIHIYDKVPEGTELVKVYDGGTEKNGRITWVKDVPAQSEVIVSFVVKVTAVTDTKTETEIETDEVNEEENVKINQIDNTAIVDGNPTEETHNPIIYPEKSVKVIDTNGNELDNQAVVPGTHLRYYITLTNDSEYDGTTVVRDAIPEGTTLYNEQLISEGGVYDEDTNTITWENVTVEHGKTAQVYFDITVNNNRKDTVANKAIVGPDKPIIPIDNPEDPDNPIIPDEPEEPTYTNEVQTPVILARKTSKLYDGESYTEKAQIKYLVEIVATEVESSQTVSVGTAKLIDKFWEGDSRKVTYVSGTLKINGTVTKNNLTESEINNITVDLNAGDKAEIEYTYESNNIPANVESESQLIKNNLYWAKPEGTDPERPETDDDTEYTNPNPDEENIFKNDELVDYTDPTAPVKDPEDTDNSNKDPEKPIDTVIVEIFKIRGTKQVNTVGANNTLLDNQPVIPGSRLRYTITLTNNSNSVGTTNISDVIPAGTSLIPNSIKPTNKGTNSNGTIKWNGIDVPAHGTTDVSFDVTVNNNTTATVKNTAKVGTNEDPNKQTPTNEVQTPVILARKTSKESDGKDIRENSEITYLVEIVATNVDAGMDVKGATIKLIDQFWTGDETKVEYKEGSLQTTGNISDKGSEIDTIKNIEATLNSGEKATLQYTFKLKAISDGLNIDHIENNLYWTKPGENNPERPNNNDTTNYENPNPDTNNIFDNDDLKNYEDPTAPEKDPQDNDSTIKDVDNPIDTVKVSIRRYTSIPFRKVWVDTNYESKRPENIQVQLLDGNNKVIGETKTLNIANNESTCSWNDLPIVNVDGTTINYKAKEILPSGYEDSYTVSESTTNNDGELTITNTYKKPTVTLTKKYTESSEEEVEIPLDVVFILDTSASMINNKGTNGKTRAYNMVEAVNKTVNDLKKNPDNRISIVGYSNSSSVIMPLTECKDIECSPNSSGQFITQPLKLTGSNENDARIRYTQGDTSRRVSGGTYTQGGIALGTQQLINAGSKTVLIEGERFTRVPVIILLSDGLPTRFSTAYNNVDPYTYEDGDANSESVEQGYYTIMTAKTYKQRVTNAYKVTDPKMKARMYTVAININSKYGQTVLNPTTDRINELGTSNEYLTDSQNRYPNRNKYYADVNFYKLLNNDENGYIGLKSDGSKYLEETRYSTELTGFDPNRINNNGYSYADGAYTNNVDNTTLIENMKAAIQHATPKEIVKNATQSQIDLAQVEIPDLDYEQPITITANGVTYDKTEVIKKIGNIYYLDLTKLPANCEIRIEYCSI